MQLVEDGDAMKSLFFILTLVSTTSFAKEIEEVKNLIGADFSLREKPPLIEYLHDKYKIAKPKLKEIIQASKQVAAEYDDIDYTLILAIIETESSFKIRAISSKGCSGLMQIKSKWLTLHDNIKKGTSLLHTYLKNHKNLKLALQKYNGNLKDRKHRYASKILRNKVVIDSFTKHEGGKLEPAT